MDETFGEVVVAAVPVPLLLPFLGAIAGCHCWAPLGRNFGEVVVAAVPGCHCRAPLVDQTFGEVAAVPGCQGAILRCHIAGCQCKVPWSAGCNGQVPYLGAMWWGVIAQYH